MLPMPVNIPIDIFLQAFFEPGETICLRVFDDLKRGIFQGKRIETSLEALVNPEADILPALKAHNEQARGVYFVVNYGGHEDSDITRINAHFVERDDVPMDEQYRQIAAFALEPSIIVKTQKSLHCYWLVRNADVASFRRVQRKLIAQFSGDRTCINESRVLRLPGFNHCKAEPVPVECIKFNPELRYTQTQLESVLPALPDEAAPKAPAPKGTRQGIALVMRKCSFLQHCREHAATLSEHDWYAMIANLAVFEGGEAAIHALSKAYPKYRQEETQQKIDHFLASGTKPITCRTIAEKGFRCPKLTDGGCSCKAPAGLCYQPLTMEDYQAVIDRLPVQGNFVQDSQTAQAFIKEYLFNADACVAQPCIESLIKERFGFKSSFISALTALYKSVCRDYKANKDAGRFETSKDLPDWYEPLQRGGLRFLPGVLADHLGKTEKVFYGTGCFFTYENGVYSANEDLWASAKVREYLIQKETTMRSISDAVGQWRMIVRRNMRELNSNPYIINVRNGLYNIPDKTLRQHTPDYLSTVQIHAAYDESATCPQFLAFLDSILDAPEIHLVQEILGYLLIPVNKAQKSFLFAGAPNAGKSTLLSVAQDILIGSENVSNIPWQNLGDRFNKAEFFGKLANIFADLPSKALEDNGMFKALTGDDFITAERKGKDPFTFRSYARFLFSCNDIPRNLGDRSEGFYRRLIIIRFNRSIPVEKRDVSLLDKLGTERDGILLWALDGLQRLIKQNFRFTETESTRESLERYRIESDSALSFVKEYCVFEEAAVVFRDDLYTHYKDYCMQSGLKPVSQIRFYRDIESRYQIGRGRDRLSKRRTWTGIAYNEDGNE